MYAGCGPSVTHFLATRALHSKAAVRHANRRPCLSAPNDVAHLVGAVEPESIRRKSAFRPRSDPAIIHPRFAVWYKMGTCGFAGVFHWRLTAAAAWRPRIAPHVLSSGRSGEH